MESLPGSSDLRTRNPATGASRTILAPPRTLGSMSQWDGVASTVRLDGHRVVYARRSVDGNWQDFPVAIRLGEGDGLVNGFPLNLFESSTPGQFLAMNFSPLFWQGGEGSPCAWWRQGGDGTLEAAGLVSLELDGPVFLPTPGGTGLDRVQLATRYRGVAPFLDSPVRVPGAFLVASAGAGILWVVRDSPTHPVRVIRLLGLDEGRLCGRIAHPPVLLGLQPMPNGHVLAALRPEKSVLEPSFTEGEIVWKDIDPKEGKAEPADPDLVAAYPVTRVADFVPFTFRPGGRLMATAP